MTANEIATWDAITEIEMNLDESEIPAAIAELDPKAREMLAEMAGDSIERQRYILSHIKALGEPTAA